MTGCGFLSLDFPAFAVALGEELIGGLVVGELEVLGVPFEGFACAMGQVAEEIVLDERSGVIEVAERFSFATAGCEPFVVVPEGFLDALFGAFVVLELIGRAEDVLSVVGNEDAVFSDKGDPDAPFADLGISTDEGLDEVATPSHAFRSVIPFNGNIIRVLPGNFLPWRGGNRIGGRAFGFDRGWMAEVEGPPGEVDEVASHVAKHAVTKFPAAIPVEVAAFPVALIVCAVCGWSEPDIPIDEVIGRFGFEDRWIDRIDRAAAPNVGFFDFSNRTRLDQLHGATVAASGVNLRSHLGSDFSFGVFLLHPAGFLHGMGERFFAVDVLSGPHRGDGGWGVMVIGSTNDDGVDFGVGDHFPPISGGFGIFESLLNGCEGVAVDVTERVDMLSLDSVEIGSSATAGSDDAHAEFAVG